MPEQSMYGLSTYMEGEIWPHEHREMAVGKYTSPMDPMGMCYFCFGFSDCCENPRPPHIMAFRTFKHLLIDICFNFKCFTCCKPNPFSKSLLICHVSLLTLTLIKALMKGLFIHVSTCTFRNKSKAGSTRGCGATVPGCLWQWTSGLCRGLHAGDLYNNCIGNSSNEELQ